MSTTRVSTFAQRRWLTILMVSVLAGCAGSEGAASAGDVRTIAVSMTDELRFEPDAFSVAAGETVRFEVTNEGQSTHEFLIGDAAAQEDFEAEMADAGMHHETDAGISVDPGQTDSFEYTFDTEAGELLAGCHEPGHYDGGMVATITVTN